MGKYAHLYVDAAKLTLGLGLAGIIFSLIIGLACSLIQYYKIPGLKRVVSVSGLAIGLSHAQVMQHVIFPQALSISVPALCANVIFLIKETSVFSAVALADLMYVAKDLIGLYYQTDEALLMLVIAYLILLLPISLAAAWLERRLRYAGFGN